MKVIKISALDIATDRAGHSLGPVGKQCDNNKANVKVANVAEIESAHCRSLPESLSENSLVA